MLLHLHDAGEIASKHFLFTKRKPPQWPGDSGRHTHAKQPDRASSQLVGVVGEEPGRLGKPGLVVNGTSHEDGAVRADVVDLIDRRGTA